MKRCLLMVCLLSLLLCSCCGGDTILSSGEYENFEINEFQSRLKEATTSDELVAITLDDFSITDQELIERWLTVLQALNIESVPYAGGIDGEAGVELSFVYPDKTVFLGVIFTSQIEVYYSTPPENALHITNYNEVKDEIAALKDACGYVHPGW